MSMKRLNLYCIFAFILFTYSCKPVYIPNVLNMPYMSEQGQVNVGLYTGTNGFDLQGAYAITDNIAVMANGSYADRDASDTSFVNDHKHKFGELGAGYFLPFGAGRFELYGGAGGGTSESYDNFFSPSKEVMAKATYSRYFFQTNIGASAKNIEGGLGLRFSFLNFSKIVSDNQEYTDGLSRAYMEPVLNLKIGGEQLKVATQIGFCAPLSPITDSTMTEYYHIQHKPFIFNIGLTYNLGGLSK